MKIYYYKQQQNTFELFDTKRPRVRARYIAIAAFAVAVVAFGIWKIKSHTSSQKIIPGTTVLPISNPNATQPVTNTLDPETQATTRKLQDNIEQGSEDETVKTQPKEKDASNTLHPKSQIVTIKSHDTLGKIFSRIGITNKEVSRILKSGEQAQQLKMLHPGKKIEIVVDTNHLVQKLSYSLNETDTLIVSRDTNNNFKLQTKSLPLEAKQLAAAFTIHSSVAGSAKNAGLSSKQITQLAGIFKTTVDFNKGNHAGDKVSVLFQDYFLNGKKIKEGEIVAAEYKTPTNTYQAVRFTDPKGNSGYYSPDGSSMQKRFLPAPLKFTRISSLFNPNRWHPILHRFRHHNGVDYAAPYGTPIKSVANGTIAFLGRKGGYGNTILIKHDSCYSTLYGHLSKYASELKAGNHVHQGQVIGYVGSSGLATGPHLHFEFRINGVHHNPLTVALPNGKSITHAYRNKFHNEVKKLLAKLDRQTHLH